jgi:hypothetical protein
LIINTIKNESKDSLVRHKNIEENIIENNIEEKSNTNSTEE